jgi:hypothetical protein
MRVLTCIACIALSRNVHAATFRGLGLDTRPLVSGDGAVVAGNLTEVTGFRWAESSGIKQLDDPSGRAIVIRGLSHDGSVIVGGLSTDNIPDGNYTMQPARWTDGTGWQYLFRTNTEDSASDVSADGSVIVGDFSNPSAPGRIAFRWTAAGGVTELNFGANGGEQVSDDGSVVVGHDFFSSPLDQAVWRWTSETGAVYLPAPPQLNLLSYGQPVLSADGRVIAGGAGQFVDGVCCRTSAFRWTAESGMVLLNPPPGFASNGLVPSAISGDGSVIVGGALMWDAANGTRLLEEVFFHEHGLAPHVQGWSALKATGISTNARVIVGSGINPQGKQEAWIARLDQAANANGPPGNFNGDGYVDAADYVSWRNGLGSKYSQADYGVWRSNFGNQRPGVPRGTPVSSADVSSAKDLLSFVVDVSTFTQEHLVQPTMVEYAGRLEGNSIIVSPGDPAPTPGNRSKLLTNDFDMETGITNPVFGPTAAVLSFSPPLVNGPGPDLVVFEITRTASEPPDAFEIQINSTLGFLSSWGPQLSTVGWDVGRRNGGSPANITELENDPFSISEGNRGSALYGLAVDLDEFGVGPLEQVSTIQFGSFGADSFDPVLFMGIRSAAALAGEARASIPEPPTVVLILFAISPMLLLYRAHHAGLPFRRRRILRDDVASLPMRLVTSLAFAAVLMNGQPASAEPLLNPYTGHWYDFVAASEITWNDAKLGAETLNYAPTNDTHLTGYLATITSHAEELFLQSHFGASSKVWIGASDAAVEGEWRWVTGPEADADDGSGQLFWQGGRNGTALGYENWITAAQPNALSDDEDYIYWSHNRSGGWNDVAAHSPTPLDMTSGYFVEYGDSVVPNCTIGCWPSDIRTWAFEATIVVLDDPLFEAADVRLGDTIRGTFSYDQFIVPGPGSDSEYAEYFGSPGFRGLQVVIENPRTETRLEYGPLITDDWEYEVDIWTDDEADDNDDVNGVDIYAWTVPPNPEWNEFINLWFERPGLTSDLSLPTELDLNDWPQAVLWMWADFAEYGLDADVHTLWPVSPGDYDLDRDVDIQDYDAWHSDYGVSGYSDVDGNRDSQIDAADYVTWRNNLPAAGVADPAAGIPEPASAALGLLALAWVVSCRRADRPRKSRPRT